MATKRFDRDEIEHYFKAMYLAGPVNEDWVAWSRFYTDDAVYYEHFWGTSKSDSLRR